jgi:citrate synthase
MNVSMPIAAVLLDLDFPPSMIKAIPLLARAGGILAHLAEEQQNSIGFVLAGQAEAAVAYRGRSGT